MPQTDPQLHGSIGHVERGFVEFRSMEVQRRVIGEADALGRNAKHVATYDAVTVFVLEYLNRVPAGRNIGKYDRRRAGHSRSLPFELAG